jgi:mannose-6-phosphate isomerase
MPAPLSPEPCRLKRLTVTKPWAGNRLVSLFPRLAGKLPPSTGETIEAASFEATHTLVADGPLTGMALSDMAAAAPPASVFGTADPDLPVMLKLLDTAAPLSVQVHPADVRLPGGRIKRGKSECWLVLHAEPSACIWQGAKAGLSPADFWRLAETGRVDEALNRREVRAGDFIDNPAGMIHAIGGGLVLAELQQACNTTLRIYDWNDAAASGHLAAVQPATALSGASSRRQRPLHPVEARAAANLGHVPRPAINVPEAVARAMASPTTNGSASVELRAGEPFGWRSHHLQAGASTTPAARARASCALWTCLGGKARIVAQGPAGAQREFVLEAPDTLFVPAAWRVASVDANDSTAPVWLNTPLVSTA